MTTDEFSDEMDQLDHEVEVAMDRAHRDSPFRALVFVLLAWIPILLVAIGYWWMAWRP